LPGPEAGRAATPASETISHIGLTVTATGGKAQHIGPVTWPDWQMARETGRIKAATSAVRDAATAVTGGP